MFRAVIVEDEFWALRWISNIFKWEHFGFEVIAQTLDPEEAFEIICSQKPDVVFTDIRMPEISGLDLMKMTREKGIDTEFVIISGFAEFSYAQEAIREGAFDYRLKPVQKNEADELLARLCSHLEEKWRRKDFDVLESLMVGDSNIEEMIALRGLGSTRNWYQTAIVVYNGKSDKKENPFADSGTGSLEFSLGPYKKLYITNSNVNISETISNYYGQMFGEAGICIGVSRQSDKITDISRLIKEADISSSSDFIYEKSSVYSYKKPNYAMLKNTLEKIFAAMDTGSLEEIKAILDRLPEFFVSNELGMDEVVYFWNQIVTSVTEAHRDRSSCFDMEYMNYHQLLDKFDSLKAVCEHLVKFFYSLGTEDVQSADKREVNANFEKLLEYVDKNYQNKLQLKELAGKFFINFTYCSGLFKKYTGSTFSEYLTTLRMKKSRELLENKRLTIEQVCEETGYGDYYYFISLFKKYHGLTPSQYRKNCDTGYKQKEVAL